MNKILIIIIGLTIFRLTTINYTLSDETTYLAMGTSGLNPYQDFLLAHPPLILLGPIITNTILGIRIYSLIIQILIILTLNEILKTLKQDKTNRALIITALIINASFVHPTNLQLGYAELTLLMMASYYFNLKGDQRNSYLMAALACCVRLFALFFLIGMSLKSLYEGQKKQAINYLLCSLPIIIICLLVPGMMNQVFLFQVNNKTYMSDSSKLLIILEYLGINLGLLLQVRQTYKQALLVFLCLFIGMFIQKTVFLMYAALPLSFLVISILVGKTRLCLIKACLFTLVLTLAYCMLTDYQGTIVDEVSISYLRGLAVYNVSFTGNMNMAGLASYVTGLPMTCNIYDTSYWNVGLNDMDGYIDCLASESHIFFCYEMDGYHTPCELINKDDYELLGYLMGMGVYYYDVNNSD